MSLSTLIPKSLLHFLREACTQFSAEDEVTQWRVARLLWMCRDPRRAHRRYAGCASISKQDLREVFGSDAEARRVLRGKYFLVLKGDNLSGYTAAYRPADNLHAAMEACVSDPALDDLVDETGARVVAQRGAIAPRRAGTGTQSGWAGIAPQSRVPVSTDGMLAYLPFAAPLEQQVLRTLIRLARNRAHPSSIPHRYQQYPSGRLFAGSPSLQSAPRAVRAAALHDCWDYDMANCHFTVFADLARQAGRPVPVVEDYLLRKRQMRREIAAEARITEEQAKACLIMIMYGAQLRSRMRTGPADEDWEPLAIAKEIGMSAAARLFACEKYVNLHKEVEQTRAAVIELHRMRGGFVRNIMGSSVSLRAAGQTPAKLLAHILQGYEAAALRAVVRVHRGDVLLCLHDGWVTRDRINVAGCERAIFEATGIHLCIEENQLVHPMHAGPPRQVSEGEISVEDQGLAQPVSASYASSSSPLAGAPLSSVRAERPRDSLILTLRPDWNFPPD